MDDSWSISSPGPAISLKREARNLGYFSKGLRRAAVIGVRDISRHAAERSVANAPVRTGLLRRSIHSTPVTVTGAGGTVYSAKVVVDPVAWYAPLMFTFLSPHAVFHIYNLGPLSRIQPMTVEGGVGGTWTERVFRTHDRQYGDKFLELVDHLFFTGDLRNELRLNP